MQRLSLSLIGLALILVSLIIPQQQAQAIPFLDVGPKVGYGMGLLSGNTDGISDSSTSIIAGGIAASFDLVMVQLEVDVLYLKTETEITTSVLGSKVTGESDSDFLSLPIIGRFDISPVPMFKLAIGGGYERRFYLGDGESPELNYLPLSVRGDLKVPMIGAVGVEGRYNHQLGDAKTKNHEFMIFLHAFL